MNANATNGDLPGGDTAEIKEHLRAAGDAAASAAKARATRAQDWARSQWNDVQQRIESEPYRAAALALGAGFLAGVLVMLLARRSD